MRRVARRIRYPDYKSPSEYHDIALLKMDRAVTFDAYVRPACLPSWRQLQDVQAAIATGWGLVDYCKSIFKKNYFNLFCKKKIFFMIQLMTRAQIIY